MTQVTMRAGDLHVDLRDDEADAEDVCELARELQEWQMQQWVRFDGECVSTVPSLSFE